MTSRRLAVLPRLAALLGTSYFLVATSRPVEEEPWSTSTFTSTSTSSQSCWHSADTVGFHVTGTCGPEGDIVVSSPANECAIMVQGAAAVGLPSAGRFDSSSGALGTSAWHLSGYLAEGSGADTGQDAAVFTVVQDAGTGTGGPRVDGGVFTVVADAGADARVFTVVTDAAPAHGKAVLRTCTYQKDVLGPASFVCSDDGRAACTAVLTPRP